MLHSESPPVLLYYPEAKGFNVFYIKISVLNPKYLIAQQSANVKKVKSKGHILKIVRQLLVIKIVILKYLFVYFALLHL